MPSRESRGENPDEKRDVIVHYLQVLDTSGREVRKTWKVFLGAEAQADCRSLEEAVTLARQLAKRHGRRAWLYDTTGYPLKPVNSEEREGQ